MALEGFLKLADAQGIEVDELGKVAAVVIVNDDNWGNISEWKYLYDTAIEKLIEA